jgi:type II secretory pathway component HofQ
MKSNSIGYIMKRTLAPFFILVSLYSAFSQEKQSTPSTSEQATSVAGDQKNLYPIDKIPVADSITIPVLDFKNTDIRDVLRALGMQYNVNIFLEPDVTGAVSLYLTNVSVKSAIDFIVKRSNYVYTIENGIVKVFKFVTPPPPPPVKPPVVFHLKDGLLDIDVKAVDVRELARAFSDSTGINVIVDGSIDKQITARLVKMKPEKAISTLFESNGLAVTSSDGIFYVSNQTWGNDKTANTNATRRLSITVKDQKVSLEVDNAPLDQVARTIANQSGLATRGQRPPREAHLSSTHRATQWSRAPCNPRTESRRRRCCSERRNPAGWCHLEPQRRLRLAGPSRCRLSRSPCSP